MNNDNIHRDIDAMIERYLADRQDMEAIEELKRKALESEESCSYIRKKLEGAFYVEANVSRVDFDKDKAYSRFRLRTASAAGSEKKPTTRKHLAIYRRWRIVAAAAAVVTAFALPWAGYKFAKESLYSQIADITIATPCGSKTQMTLPDGTKVWLNANSKLVYSQAFGVDNREIDLTGEACFDVTKNEDLPFTINSKSASLTVLGTKFTYREYPNDKSLTVELMRGHVDLMSRKTGRHMDMRPDERAMVDTRNGQMTKQNIDASHSDAWTCGELSFDEIPMEQIAQTLERTYDVKIKVADGLKSKRFYMSFSTSGMNVEEVLSTMAETHRMSYRRISQNNYYIY